MPTPNRNRDMDKVEQQLAEIVAADVHEVNASTLPKIPREQPPFVTVSDQSGEALVEAAKAVFVEAENCLRECEQYREHLHADITKRAEELSELMVRVKMFRAAVQEARKSFHGEPVKAAP